MKNILGLDLGTNSIGWALVQHNPELQEGKILGAGSRILPMSQEVIGKFDRGISISQTAERTSYRSIRRLRERHLLRRERLHRVLNIINFLPSHYAASIDFKRYLGQFLPETEPKIAYQSDLVTNKPKFVFQESFNEMLKDFQIHQPELVLSNKKIPYDWTIYFLRKKALTRKIEKEELAWILLHFNQKRGYYQLRGEDEEVSSKNKIELYTLMVTSVTHSSDKKTEDEKTWYNVHLENGWIYRRSSKTPLDWNGKLKDFIVTTEVNEDGSIKLDKEGKEKRSFRSPGEDDWTLLKNKTERDITNSTKTLGTYIYETLIKNPTQKIKGKLVRVIERKFYKKELESILKAQLQFHPELSDHYLYEACCEDLYKYNEAHKKSLKTKDFTHLFINDIIFFQRPLKSKKSLISNCTLEFRNYIKNGESVIVPIKCIAKSHPLFQEFRLWQFLQNLKIIQKERVFEGRLETDVDVTGQLIRCEEDRVNLFDWLNQKKDVDQKSLLKYPGFNLKKNIENFRWNYVEDKSYPCNETRALIIAKLNKIDSISSDFLTYQKEEALWHILYSVEDKENIVKALQSFALKYNLSEDFVEAFKKFPTFKKEYGSYSTKAIKKLLELMRIGKYWAQENLSLKTKSRIEKIITGEYDKAISSRVREKCFQLNNLSDFKGLPLWLASYIIYNKHFEGGNTIKWKFPDDISLLKQNSLRNPIVEQLINETLKVVKEIWEYYGNSKENFFNEIHIELGREMKNPAEARLKITKQANENENTNLRIKALLAELLNDNDVENVRPYSPSQQEILKIYEEGALQVENIPDEILKISKQAQPNSEQLIKYKLWMEQKYRSPYTNQIIPLNKLFTHAYEIEHIIPQSRYFDDSFSNKVICESAVNNEKGNQTAFEFILNEGGKSIDLGAGKNVPLLTKLDFENYVKQAYSKSRVKMKKLLMEEIPDSFIQRQLNESRYISKVVKNLMSNIVREEGELESNSKNVVVVNGAITSALKQAWGLHDVWNELIRPRFERLNLISNSNKFGEWQNKSGKKVFQTQLPLELQKGFSKKRVDHRHHALDAIIVALTTRNHVNFLNNESALGTQKHKQSAINKRYDLRQKLCTKTYESDNVSNYKWIFNKPWNTVTQETREILSSMIVTFKQNVRVISKTNNYYQGWIKNGNGQYNKGIIKQSNAENFAIRKPLHKETISGLVKLKLKKFVSLANALDDLTMIVDKEIKNQIKKLVNDNYDKKQILKFFNDQDFKIGAKDISKVEIFYWDNDNVATRVKVDETFNSAKIQSITDQSIQSIMLNHLYNYNELVNGKNIEHPEIAFSQDGIEAMNKNIFALNNNQNHQPIFKVRTYELKGNKFQIGTTGNKKTKYAEAAQGTNLFFGIYLSEQGKRSYDTIPLNIALERQKQGLSPVPELSKFNHKLLFYLSPNDLIFIAEPVSKNGDMEELFDSKNESLLKRVYKIVSFTGNRLYAVPFTVAKSIVDKYEYSQLNKLEFSLDKRSIKEHCIKLSTNRLGKLNTI